jgi:acetylglutamate kinase
MERTIPLLSAVPYLRAYAGQVFVVKLGGDLLADAAALRRIARDVAVLFRLRIGVVVVHGGGPQLDEVSQRLGLPVERVAGRRVTTPAVLDAAKMVFRGRINLDLVSALLQEGEKALGICGADGRVVQARRREASLVRDDAGREVAVDWGEVGDVTGVDPAVLQAVLGSGTIPVVGPLAADADGAILNVNADTMAAEIAISLRAAKLIVLTGVPGVLENVADPHSLLHWTDLEELTELEAKGAFSGGMRPKVAAIRRAIEGGVPRVHVIDGRRDGAVLEEVFTTDGCGTLVVRESDDAPIEPHG